MKCECSLRGKLIGDGCSVCNPAQALEYAMETIEGLEKEIEEFESRTCDSCMYYGEKHCANAESIAFTSQEAVYEDDGCNKWESIKKQPSIFGFDKDKK